MIVVCSLGPGCERPVGSSSRVERRCNGRESATLGPRRCAARAPPITRRCARMTDRVKALSQLLDQRIAVLDGAWGTMLQGAGLTPADYRGDRFAGHSHDVT